MLVGRKKYISFLIVLGIITSFVLMSCIPHFKRTPVNVCDSSRHFGILNPTVLYENKTCFRLYWNNSLQFYEELRSSKDVYQNVTGKCFRFLTINSSFGRMGNQMFQLASLFGLACEYDYIPIIPTSQTFIKKYFDIPNMVDETKIRSCSREVKCIAHKFAVHYNCLKELNNTYQDVVMVIKDKLLQSWKYFHKCKHVIRRIFQLKDEYMNNARTFLTEVSLNSSTSVCIHVRRGDALNIVEQELGREVVSATDIQRAQRYYIEHFRKVIFIVLSDDIPWCNRTMKGNVVFSPFNDPGDDMALMTQCDHVVITSGTFGWWGAWLSVGTTLYFKGFPRPDSTLDINLNRDDYYPRDWIPY